MTPLMIKHGGAVVHPAAVVAVELRPWVLQATPARVLLHLVGGQTLTEFCGDGPSADERAEALFATVKERWFQTIESGEWGRP